MEVYIKMNIQREMALKEVMAEGFSAFDLHLYLNTHPCDQQALMLFKNCSKRARFLTENYERNFGPLTAGSAYAYPWQWIKSPWPWEC